MATITFKGDKFNTTGSLPSDGKAPPFKLTGADLSPVSLENFAGKKVLLNIVPSVDTGICAMSARRFNEEATAHPDTIILTVSRDLPFALGRFCAAEGIESAVMASGFRDDSFGSDYGVTIKDGPFATLYSRAVVLLDKNHAVVYNEQVPEITQEPNYDAALKALAAL